MGSFDLDLKAIARTTQALVYEHLRAGKTTSFVVSTSSMWPTLAPGDKVFIRAVRAGELRLGDIVIRSLAGAWIAHRLIGRAAPGNEHHLFTKGDNALSADDLWQAAQLVGAVVAVERAGQRKKSVSPARARWGGVAVALLSRGQLSANRISPRIFRRVAVKGLRVCLRIAVRIAL
ncbi:MAG TPA: S24/S26 family peptidase [Blastocatellia bacterium]|nr:S24/S26 family peptidase [Blastocatellia bacterium]